jgi:hypothetical protein
MTHIDYIFDAVPSAGSKKILSLKETESLSTGSIIGWDNKEFWTNFHRSSLGSDTFFLFICSKFPRGRQWENQTLPM